MQKKEVTGGTGKEKRKGTRGREERVALAETFQGGVSREIKGGFMEKAEAEINLQLPFLFPLSLLSFTPFHH